jgi:hypothetical protein
MIGKFHRILGAQINNSAAQLTVSHFLNRFTKYQSLASEDGGAWPLFFSMTRSKTKEHKSPYPNNQTNAIPH